MNLRKLFSLGAAAGMATAAAAASLVSDNVYGILALADTTSPDLIIAVPWVDCTDASQGTFVSNVVKTTNLKAGDYIIRKSGDTYQSWVLSGTAPALYWKPQVVADKGITTVTDGADTARMARGDALWLHRADPANSSPVYLFGQYTSAAASTKIVAGSTTLVASPAASDLKVSDITSKISSVTKGDNVIVTTATGAMTYTYNGTAWTYKTTATDTSLPALPGGQSASLSVTVPVTDSNKIPAGTGFWYQSKAGSGEKTITW